MSIHCNSKKQIPSDRRYSTSALHIYNKRRFYSSYYDDKDRVQGSMADIYHLKLYVKLLQKEKMKALAEAAKLEAQILDAEVKIAQNELKYFKSDMKSDGEKDKYGRASKKLKFEEDCKSKPREMLNHKSSEKENSERKHKMPRKDSKSRKSRSTDRKHTDIKSSKCIQPKDALSQKKTSHNKSKNKTSHSELPVTEEKVPQLTKLPQKPVLNEVAQSHNGAQATKEDAALSQKKSSHHKSKNKTSHSELPVTEEKVPQHTELPQKPVLNEVAQSNGAQPTKEDITIHPESLENNKINNILFKEILANKRYNGGNDDTGSINSACTLILKTGNCLFNDDLIQT